MSSFPLIALALLMLAHHDGEVAWSRRFHPHVPWDRAIGMSLPYVLMWFAAVAEYLVELWYAPQLFVQPWISVLGVVVAVAGQTLRSTAMHTAEHHFTHHITQRRRPGHELVTHGVYARVRHPAYLGLYVWAVGLMLLLVNPLTLVLTLLLVGGWIRARIREEEGHLTRIFPESFPTYRRATPTWIPFVR